MPFKSNVKSLVKILVLLEGIWFEFARTVIVILYVFAQVTVGVGRRGLIVIVAGGCAGCYWSWWLVGGGGGCEQVE